MTTCQDDRGQWNSPLLPSLAWLWFSLPICCPDSLSLQFTYLGRKNQCKDFRRDKEEGLRQDPVYSFDGEIFPKNYSGRTGLLSPSCGHELGIITEGRHTLRYKLASYGS